MIEYRIEYHKGGEPLMHAEGLLCEPEELEATARDAMAAHGGADSAVITRLDDTGEAWVIDASGLEKVGARHAR